MKKHSINLGGNAFIALDGETFASLDTAEEEKRLKNEGKQRGARNMPAADENLDAEERGIITSVANTVRQTRQAVQEHFSGFSDRLGEILSSTEKPDALINQIQTVQDALKTKLSDALDKCKSDLDLPQKSLDMAKKSYDAFRRENGLDRNPKYDTTKKIIFLFTLLVVAEAFVSSNLLWGFLGVIPAFFQTSLITLLNVVFFAWMFGMLFRWKQLFPKYSRLKSWACGALGSALGLIVLLGVLFLNLGVGHYRDAVVDAEANLGAYLGPSDNFAGVDVADLDFFDFAQKAMANMKSSLFGIDSILSGLLFLVGVVCFVVAAWKWYSAFDPYPGYSALHKDLEKQHGRCKHLVEKMREKISSQKQNADNKISDTRTKLMNARTLRNQLVGRANAVRQGYDAWVVVLEQKQNQLLQIYRGANRHARNDRAPEHFNREEPVDPQLANAPEFSPPDLPELEVKKVLEVVESSLNANQENYEKVRVALANMMPVQS
ncbi:MAG: hypothetical protein MPK31_01755 [Gammaproteobacteria bacterium]|nr:hypothetical protein [Gammaproteobacteria bacterium]